MNGLQFAFFFLVVAIIVLFVVNRIQKCNFIKGRIASDEELSRRSRWAIYLAGISIVPLIITLSDYKIRNDLAEAQSSIQDDILWFNYWEDVPNYSFVEGLYSREELDVLEADYRELGQWVSTIREDVYQSFKDLKPVVVDTSSAPIHKSHFSYEIVSFYRRSILSAISDYNKDIDRCSQIKTQRDELEAASGIATFIMPIGLFLAIVLQLNVVFWEYHRKQR